MDSPRFISSNALLISLSGITWVIIGSISILPCMYQSTIFGTSVRPPCAAERGAFPHPAGHQLKRPRGNLGTRGGYYDYDRLASAAMAGFQSLPHDRDVA